MTINLEELLDTFPLPKPDSVSTCDDGTIIASWQWDGKYFEIEIDENEASIMTYENGIFKHWSLDEHE